MWHSSLPPLSLWASMGIHGWSFCPLATLELGDGELKSLAILELTRLRAFTSPVCQHSLAENYSLTSCWIWQGLPLCEGSHAFFSSFSLSDPAIYLYRQAYAYLYKVISYPLRSLNMNVKTHLATIKENLNCSITKLITILILSKNGWQLYKINKTNSWTFDWNAFMRLIHHEPLS